VHYKVHRYIYIISVIPDQEHCQVDAPSQGNQYQGVQTYLSMVLYYYAVTLYCHIALALADGYGQALLPPMQRIHRQSSNMSV
jgi:hypothetical protein